VPTAADLEPSNSHCVQDPLAILPRRLGIGCRGIQDKLELEGVTAASRSDDSEFLRRLYLDAVGTVPTPEEVEVFLGDRSRDKRARKIDELLASETYAENWATWWFRDLTGLSPHQGRVREGQGGRYVTGEGGKRFHAWLSGQMAVNRPYNEVVQDLISATGRTDENGAAGYLARWESDANNTAGAVSKHFLGVQIQCAQCHDHLYEEFVAGGMAGKFGSQSHTGIIYRSPKHLLESTPQFIQSAIESRLDGHFASVHLYAADHFGGRHLYMDAIQDNYKRLELVLAGRDPLL